MATKIRLQRHGKKGRPFYHIVIADSRVKRDGRFIEKLGTYDPNTNPATIDLDFDSALSWMKKGAQPTDTARAILQYKGVVFKNHLDKGVLKGALTQEQADKKFEAWLSDKESKIANKSDEVQKKAAKEAEERLKKEQEANEERAKAIAAKNTPEPEAPAEEEAPAAEAAEETAAPAAEEAPAEEAKADAPAEETKEAPKAEAKEEAPAEEAKAEEKKEEPKAEEAPAEEEKKEEEDK